MKSNKVEKVVVFFLELHFKANVSLKMLIEQKYYQCVTKQSTYIAQIYGINYEKCQMKLIYKNCAFYEFDQKMCTLSVTST